MKKLLWALALAPMLGIQPICAQDALSNATASTETKSSIPKHSYIEDFGSIYLSYFGGYKNFDKGYYGIGIESFWESGAFYNLSFHGSWGIMDPGEMQYRFGGGYAYAPAEFFAVTGRINGMLGTGTKYEYNKKTGKLDTKNVFGGGILFAPGVRLKLSKLLFGVNFDLGWAYLGTSGFYKDVELMVGYEF